MFKYLLILLLSLNFAFPATSSCGQDDDYTTNPNCLYGYKVYPPNLPGIYISWDYSYINNFSANAVATDLNDTVRQITCSDIDQKNFEGFREVAIAKNYDVSSCSLDFTDSLHYSAAYLDSDFISSRCVENSGREQCPIGGTYLAGGGSDSNNIYVYNTCYEGNRTNENGNYFDPPLEGVKGQRVYFSSFSCNACKKGYHYDNDSGSCVENNCPSSDNNGFPLYASDLTAQECTDYIQTNDYNGTFTQFDGSLPDDTGCCYVETRDSNSTGGDNGDDSNSTGGDNGDSGDNGDNGGGSDSNIGGDTGDNGGGSNGGGGSAETGGDNGDSGDNGDNGGGSNGGGGSGSGSGEGNSSNSGGVEGATYCPTTYNSLPLYRDLDLHPSDCSEPFVSASFNIKDVEGNSKEIHCCYGYGTLEDNSTENILKGMLDSNYIKEYRDKIADFVSNFADNVIDLHTLHINIGEGSTCTNPSYNFSVLGTSFVGDVDICSTVDNILPTIRKLLIFLAYILGIYYVVRS